MVFKKKTLILLLTASIGIAMAFYLFGGSMEAFSKRIPEVEKAQFIQHSEDWRNLRYAEIIPVFRSGAKFYVEVYNTVGSNELPQHLWEKLDEKQMAEEYGAEKVILNGPRYWVVNKIEGKGETKNGKVANFGGIEMTQRAVLHSNIFKGTVGGTFYTENAVVRETTYYYWKGNMVYELNSPTGDTYRMQSYCQIKDPSLTIEKLQALETQLRLPDGWSYNGRVLNENSTMVASGIAYIINDDLGNSYQKIIHKVPSN